MGRKRLQSHRPTNASLVADQGHDRARLLLYKAVYAIVTSNVFDPDGADGHTAWCADLLGRADIRAALLGRDR